MAMKIAAHIDSVDAIPEDATIKVRDLYEEVDGGGYAVVLQPKNGWNNENVSGLKDSLRKRRDGTERLDELEAQIAKFTELGTLEELSEALETRRKLAEKYVPSDEAKAAKEAYGAELKQQHKKEIEKLMSDLEARDKSISALDRETSKLLIDAAVRGIMSRNKNLRGNTDRVIEHLRSSGPHGKSRAQVIREDGKPPRVVILADEDGKPKMTTKANSTDDMELEEYLGSLRENESWRGVFYDTVAQGVGGDPDATTSVGSDPSKVRITEADMNDFSRYQQLREEAMKEGKGIELPGAGV